MNTELWPTIAQSNLKLAAHDACFPAGLPAF